MLSGTAPTTSGISDLYVNADAANEVIWLSDVFEDAEDADHALKYEVVGNTNSHLFDSVDIDSYGGLALDFAADASGKADLTIRATDYGGLWAETSFAVNVAPVINHAPVVGSGIPDVNVREDAADKIIELSYAFDDVDDDPEDITYGVVGNTNSSLFDSLNIGSDSYGGYGGLVLDFAADAFGEAELTIRATDYGGLWVETSLTVNVAPVDDAPVISDFGGSEGYGSFWTFHGKVTDVDDDVEGMIVTFGGVLAGYGFTTEVRADGTFSLAKEFPGLQGGAATAQIGPPERPESNVAWYMIVVT